MDGKRQQSSISFPAMEALLGRLAKDDLMIISGFLFSCFDQPLKAALDAISALEDQQQFDVEAVRAPIILAADNCRAALSKVSERFLESGNTPVELEIDALRKYLRSLFPNIDI